MNRKTLDRSLALLVIALVVLDWVTKLWVTNRLTLGESWAVVEGWLYFVHRQNPGVAFSLFAEIPDAVRVPLLAVLSLVGIYLFARVLLSTSDRITRLAAAVVIAGAVGNFGDRLVSGEVTDFVFFPLFPFVFNVADAAITLGGIVLAIRLLMLEEKVPEPRAVGSGTA